MQNYAPTLVGAPRTLAGDLKAPDEVQITFTDEELMNLLAQGATCG